MMKNEIEALINAAHNSLESSKEYVDGSSGKATQATQSIAYSLLAIAKLLAEKGDLK